LTVLGSAGPDNLSYTPTGASAGTVTGVGPTVNFTGVGGTFTIDALGGANALTVIGTAAANTITADGTTVTVGTFQTVTYASFHHLNLTGLQGNDTFNVTPAAGVSMFVDGGDPIGALPGDLLNLNAGGAAATLDPGPLSGSGSFTVTGDLPVSF